MIVMGRLFLLNIIFLYPRQACQGAQFDGGVRVDVADAKHHMPAREVQVHKIPSEADFLIAYSVVPGT